MGIEERTQEREIEGVKYSISPLPFGVGKQAMVRLMKIVAPFAANFAVSAGGGEDAKVAAIRGALQSIAALIGEDDLKYFDKVFAPYTMVTTEGKQVPLVGIMEAHFSDGEWDRYFGWLQACIEVNFGKFFTNLLGKAKRGAALPAEGQATSG